jgi:rhodanese-related sulfurtransferase
MSRLIALLLFSILCALPAAAEEYPLRAKFPTVKPIGSETLAAAYERAVIVDVRSRMEYDVVHINKAVHLPVDIPTFLADLRKLRAPQGSEPIAFYCNGTTCAKSYEAAEKAESGGFGNVFVYDAGILAWIKSYPERGTLLGRTPAPLNRLIAEDAFKKRLIDFPAFRKRAETANALVIDIRDKEQIQANAELGQNAVLFIPGASVMNIPADKFKSFVTAGGFKGKTLLIADAVAKEVRWAQYILEDNGYSDYFFLAKGVNGAVESGHLKK